MKCREERKNVSPSRACRAPDNAAEQTGEAFYHLSAVAVFDVSVTARILQCFVRNGCTPIVFLATMGGDDEILVEASMRRSGVDAEVMRRIAANVAGVIGVTSSELTCDRPRPAANLPPAFVKTD